LFAITLPSKKSSTIVKSASAVVWEATMFCLDEGLWLDVFFTFIAFLLVFAIGLGLGLLARGG
jgi:hypothetical protein